MEAEESVEETVEAAVVAEDVEDIKENVQKRRFFWTHILKNMFQKKCFF